MSSLLKKLRKQIAENEENLLLIRLQVRALELGYSESVVNAAIDATIKSGLITTNAFYNHLKDTYIKSNK